MSAEDVHWQSLLEGCDYQLAARSITAQFKGSVIKTDLSRLLDAYSADPGFQSAIALIKYAPDLIVFFQESKPGGFFTRYQPKQRQSVPGSITSEEYEDILKDIDQDNSSRKKDDEREES